LYQKIKLTSIATAIERRITMKTSVKTAFGLGVLASVTVASTIYYYHKKNNESVGSLIDHGIDSLEKAAFDANNAFRNAQTDAQYKARNVFKNVKYHAENIGDDINESLDNIDSEIKNVVKDIKKNVEKGV
jgi:chromosome condensin MukBEF complex kleisin-like MukF subunit